VLDANAWTTNDSPDEVNDIKTYLLRGKIIYNFPFATLTALPYYAYDKTYSLAQSNGNPGITQSEGETRSIEVRLDSPANQPWFWQVGVYSALNSRPLSIADTDNATGGMGQPFVQQTDGLKYDQYSNAVFATTQYPIPFVDNLKLTAGGRWQDDREQALDQFYAIPAIPANAGLACVTAFTLSCFNGLPHFLGPISYGEHWHNMSWKAGVEYQALPNALLYFNAGTGYAPGTSSDQEGSIINTASQVLLQYALGVKTRWLDNRLQLNGEIYETNYQTYDAGVGPPRTSLDLNIGPQFATLNGSAYNDGFDTDISYLVTDYDRLGFEVAYDESNYGNVSASEVAPDTHDGLSPAEMVVVQDAVAASFNGHPFLSAPKWTLQPSYQHVFPLANGATLTFRGNTQYQSKQFTDSQQSGLGENKAHTESNVYLSYLSPDSKWGLSAYVKNIENFAYVTNYNGPPPPTFTGPAQITLGPPRTWGAVLNVKF